MPEHSGWGLGMHNTTMMMSKVCVTGGAGYIGSWLVKKLLARGYFVHATLRNLNDSSKVGLLKGLPYAEDRLRLFEADIYVPETFESAVEGCEFVFHVATPLHHQGSQFKNTTEAAIAGVKGIAESCIKSPTVKRLVYTASVLSASPLKEDGTGFKDFFDESCWTPLSYSVVYCDDFTSDYITSKTLAEKEVLTFNNKEKFGLEVVSLPCPLVVGDTLLPCISGSQLILTQFLSRNSGCHQYLKLIQEMWGSIPLAHIDDVCEAHIFCIEKPLMNGRFLCAQAYPTIAQIVDYYRESCPELVVEEIGEEQEYMPRGVSRKLIDLGFQFKHDMKKMLDDTVDCARRLGSLP